MNGDVIVEVKFSARISIGTVSAIIIIEVITLGFGAGLTRKQWVIVATNEFESRFTLEIKMRESPVHGVCCTVNMQRSLNDPFRIWIIYIRIFIFRMNVIDCDIGFQISAVRNVAERLTCVFGFKLINQLRKFRICIDFITSLDDVLEILIVLCGQANTIIIVISITVDIDGVDDRSVFLRIALQIVLESPFDHGSQQTISRFRQYTGRERDFCRVYRDVLIRNQRINTVFWTTSCVPSVDGRLRILFGPVILTEISRCIIFVVMFLHHQCLTIHWRSNNGRSIDDQLAITGYIIPGVVLITVCGCCVFSLGAFRIIAIIDNKTEIVVVPDILGSIQMQSDRRVFLRALLVCEPVRTPETARQPSAVVLHVFEALFEGIDGLGIQRITHNFTVINSVQNIVTTERRRICHIDPCIRIRWS